MLGALEPAKSDVLAIGLATADLISSLSTYPNSNSRVVAQEMTLSGGGPAATAAVTLSRLGHKVQMISAVGSDQLGEMVIKGLNEDGVDTHNILVSAEANTSVSQIIVTFEKNNRLIVTKPGTGINEAVLKFDFNIPRSWIHIDQAGYAALLETGKKDTVFKNHFISIDGGNHIKDLNLTDVDLYTPTIDELHNIFGIKLSKKELLLSAISIGAQIVVATDGEHGSYAIENGELISVKAFTGPIHSTLGAGDVFHGALLSGLINKHSLSTSMRNANLAAYISCRGLDGRSAIPKRHDLEEELVLTSGKEANNE
jgi:sugar/nucleoside kinase (ribokinase family)